MCGGGGGGSGCSGGQMTLGCSISLVVEEKKVCRQFCAPDQTRRTRSDGGVLIVCSGK